MPPVKHLYVGGYGPGIVTLGGGLTRVASPSFLAAHPSLPVLYAVGELERGWLTAFSAAGEETADGVLVPLAERPSEGDTPCHVAVDPSGTLLAVANYGDGTVSLHHLDARGAFTGDPVVLPHEGCGPVADRQERSHAHQCVFHDGVIHVADLGTDEIRRYLPDGTALEPLTLQPGAGPRHLAFSGGRLYVAGELDGNVWMIEDGRASAAPASAVPGPNHPSHLLLEGDLVYVGNRGPNTVSVLRAGDLSMVAEVPSGGDWPRHFAIDGDRMYVANQRSGGVAVFAIKDGVPEPTGEVHEVDSPACVLPLEMGP
ncbi:lactonase family protein [Nonomuraea pusilla]|uniref:lactonase family protein n=1 Tax=Nonomuraea pusilla TaxID=46177 RepID=UPI000B86C80E|nr:beta-propeller fold lactonase family protein [Nonomuraea pusilla]